MTRLLIFFANSNVGVRAVCLAAMAIQVMLYPALAMGQGASVLQRQSGVQVTPDGKRVLINKDVSDQRWAITRNLDDETVTGNVYFADGGEPLFAYCVQISSAVSEITLSCQGANRCVEPPCGSDEFRPIAEVTLPKTFFAPPGSATGLADDPLLSTASSEGGATLAVRQSGLQITPDGKRTLVSKDVGGQRWAITRNLDDGTVTGNVYRPDGESPLFLYCQETSQGVDQIFLSCAGASSCELAPCDGAFQPIADVALPKSFFAAPSPISCGNGVREDGEECDGADGGCGDSVCLDDCRCHGNGKCGNGTVDPGEYCDAPNGTVLGPCPGSPGYDATCVGCDLLCQPSSLLCGNGRIDDGEQCDVVGGGCSAGMVCLDDCRCHDDGKCGNGVLDGEEQCDGAAGACGDFVAAYCGEDCVCHVLN